MSVHESWINKFGDELDKPYFRSLIEFVKAERARFEVYPPVGRTFTAFEAVPFKEVRVVILGQDPYHGPGQAHGMSFSVLPGVKPPPSLQNIYKELQSDVGVKPVAHGHLIAWAKQGVFLLNTVLTVRKGEAGSHRGQGWETFTDNVIKLLSAREGRIVFILWGKDAQTKAALINTSEHVVITSAHPSPMSAHNGFFGSKPFSRTNQVLDKRGFYTIDWQLTDNP